MVVTTPGWRNVLWLCLVSNMRIMCVDADFEGWISVYENTGRSSTGKDMEFQEEGDSEIYSFVVKSVGVAVKGASFGVSG